MDAAFLARVQSFSTAKALTLAAYGESVAAYRYRALAEKATGDKLRSALTMMADEEQGHHELVRNLLENRFPDRGFVLSDEDKELVVAGPRTLAATDKESFRRALSLIQLTEERTGLFYAALARLTIEADLRPMLEEMSAECLDHAQRVQSELSFE